MLKIFLSYARDDGSTAAAHLRTELERADFTVWRDIEDLQGGEEWKEQLRAALRMVDVVLVLLTPASTESPYVTWEWENALTLQKRVIPLLISPCKVPSDLSRLHYHNLSEANKYIMELMALVRDLNNVSDQKTAKNVPEKATDSPTMNMQGGFYQPNMQVGGEVYQAGHDMIIGDRSVNQGNKALVEIFEELMERSEALSTADQELVKPIIKQAQTQAEKIQQGDENSETLNFLEKRLKNLAKMAPDIGAVAIATLANPPLGVALAVQKIAQKVQEELKD